jgi:hypothetical protein
VGSFSEKIEVILDVQTTKAATALRGFRTSVSEADGFVGKFRAGTQAGFALVEQYAAQMALAAGASLIAFGVKAVTAFQDTALEAGKFADTTGVGVEAASRWIEVAGDIGVGADTVEKALAFMNKTLGTSPEKFAQYGVAIARAKDGTVDVNGTFLNLVDRLGQIPDRAQRTAAAAALLGRGWSGMSELIGKGADELKRSLDAVSDAKVTTPEELARAKELRETIDKLVDRVQDFALTVGGALAPALSMIGDKIDDLSAGLGKIDGAVENVTGGGLAHWAGEAVDAMIPLDNIGKGLKRTFDEESGAGEKAYGVLQELTSVVPVLGEATERLGEAIFPTVEAVGDLNIAAQVAANQQRTLREEMARTGDGSAVARVKAKQLAEATVEHYTEAYKAEEAEKAQAIALAASQQAAQAARDTQRELAEAHTRSARAADDQREANEKLSGELSAEAAFLNLAQQLDDVTASAADVAAEIAAGTLSAEEGMRRQALAVNAAKQAVLEYGEKIGGLPVEKQVRFAALIDQGQYDQVLAQLAILERNRTMELSIVAKGGIGVSLPGSAGKFHDGGVVPGPIGQEQIAIVKGGETILPTHKPGGGGVGGLTVNIAGGFVTEQAARELEKTLRRYQRGLM